MSRSEVAPQWQAYWQLARLDKPIGSLLLLWPTLWSLWLAAGGWPGWQLLAVFIAGVWLMRSAGCVINDYADRHLDGHVKRTAARPLPAGRLGSRQALVFFAVLVLASFVLVLTLNRYTIALSLVGLLLAVVYPFMKRVTNLPQLVLGLAFSWAIPMAWAAVRGELVLTTWLLFLANALWTVAYDTYYAMVDRDDDLRIGVKSTAILFGRHDRTIILLLQAGMLVCLAVVAVISALGWPFMLAWCVAGGLFAEQYWSTRLRERDRCFQAFLGNNRVGAVLFAGIVLSLL